MGKKLDALLRRRFKTKKFISTVNNAISRLVVLKNQHQSRCSVAISDVTQILKLGHPERALLRAEQVVKEESILDVFNMIEIYCYLLVERVSLLEHAKECPEELKEAISSLIYAATRCGEFPELQYLCSVFSLRFGKEFVDRAAQLRNNCGVSPKIIQKLSTKMHTIESRVKVVRKIAMENNIALQIEEDGSSVHLEKQGKMEAVEKKENQPETKSSTTSPAESLESLFDKSNNDPEDANILDRISEARKMKGKYKDVAHAAQAAFESAAHAAVAARAAVELSWFDSHDPDDQKSPRNSMQQSIINVSYSSEIIKSEPQNSRANYSRGVKNLNPDDKLEKLNHNEKEVLVRRSQSTASEDSDDRSKESGEPLDEENMFITHEKEAMFDTVQYDHIDEGRRLSSESHINNEALKSKTVRNEELFKDESGNNVSRNSKNCPAVRPRNTHRR